MNRWHIVTAGHLSRNKFWGESDYDSNHPVLATSTVIQTKQGNILVDPSMPAEEMQRAVYHACGLRPEEINIIYSTHLHNDHWMGIEGFPNAEFYMAKGDYEGLMALRDCTSEAAAKVLDRAKPADKELAGCTLVPLPGHTAGLQGLLFDAPEGKVLACGDAVMGYEYFEAKQGYFFSYSLAQCMESIEKASKIADIIIPGHGNYFSVKAYPFKVSDPEPEDTRYYGIAANGSYSVDTSIGEVLKREDGYHLFKNFFSDGVNLMGLKMSSYLPLKTLAKTMGLSRDQLDNFIKKL